MERPTIDQYLIANCLFIIDEFNIMYKDYGFQKLKDDPMSRFSTN